MSSRQEVERVLDGISRESDVMGAALVSRDGLCLRAAGKVELNRETFSAMSATLVGAAEIALSELGGGRARYIVAATDSVKMVLVGVGRDLLLVIYAAASAPVDHLLPRIEDVAKAMTTAVRAEG